MRIRPAVFDRLEAGRFKIDRKAMARMAGYLQRLPCDTEAGGLLLGRHILDCCDIVVDIVTLPMRGDIRKRGLFIRKSSSHQVLVERAWRNSKETCTYLGEWHTHPERSPTPSPVDRTNWEVRLREDTYEGDCLFFAILGTEEIAVWEVKVKADNDLGMGSAALRRV